jgi:hypothetical protein
MQPTSEQEPGPLVALAKTIEQFPEFLARWAVSTIMSIISDPLVFCVALGCVALGLLTNLLTALAVFFLLYPTLRMVATVAQSINMAGSSTAQAVVHHANVQLQAAQPPSAPATVNQSAG